MTTGQENQLKGFNLIHKGKVRDIYRYKSNEILIITSDRISAFDFVFNDEIDGKGKILTSLTKYWFRQTKNIIKNHLIEEVPKLENQLLDRAMLAHEAKVIPYEAVVRGYLTGSAWNEYQSSQTIGGVNVESGYEEFDALMSPAFTPTTKAKVGDKDKPVTFQQMEDNLGEKLTNQIREYSIKLFEFARVLYEKKGVILVDTKFEFGLDTNNELMLVDEIFTPDCSRFWMKDDVDNKLYNPYDKQIFRDYLLKMNWNNKQMKLSKDIKKKLINGYEKIYNKVVNA